MAATKKHAAKDSCWTDGSNYYRADGKGTYWQIGGSVMLKESDPGVVLEWVQDADVQLWQKRLIPPAIKDYINLCSWARGMGGDLYQGMTAEQWVEQQLTALGASKYAFTWAQHDAVAKLIADLMAPTAQEMQEFRAKVEAPVQQEVRQKQWTAPQSDLDLLLAETADAQVDSVSVLYAEDVPPCALAADTTTDPAVSVDPPAASITAVVPAVAASVSVTPGIEIDPETGEVLNPDQAFEILGIVVARRDFEISDEQSAVWFIGKMRAIQRSIEERFAQVTAMTAGEVSAYRALLQYYGPQLRAYAETQLKKNKAGEYKPKNWKTVEGSVFFKTTGGWRVFDSSAAKKHIEAEVGDLSKLLPADLAEKYGLKLHLTYSKTKLYKAAEAGEVVPGLSRLPENPLGQMGIGGGGASSAWSFNKVTEKLRAAIKPLEQKLKAITASDDDDDEGDAA